MKLMHLLGDACLKFSYNAVLFLLLLFKKRNRGSDWTLVKK